MRPITTITIAAFVFLFCLSFALGSIEFQVPSDIKLTGKLLQGPMDTQTPYLKYFWYEATAENGMVTALCVLYDIELKKPVIGFIHYAGPPDEYGNYDTYAIYYIWRPDGKIVEYSSNRNLIDNYLTQYKKTRSFHKRFEDLPLQ